MLTWQSFVIPLWGQATFSRHSQVTFMMATVALNVFGIVNSFFHLLLRSNADSMAIRPPATSWQGNRKWKFFGSNALDIGHHIISPVAWPDDRKTVSQSSSKRDKSGVDVASQRKPDAYNKSLPPPPLLTVPKYSQKRSQYSVFPTKESTRQLLRPLHPPSSIYEDDENWLRPPEAPFAGHQRHSSGVSMATVQIGLRLSNVSIPAMRSSSQKVYRPGSPFPHGPSGLREESIRLSVQSIDVPVTLRSPTSEKNSGIPEIWIQKAEAMDDSTAKAKPSVKKPINRSATMKDLPPHPPLDFKSNTKTKQAEKVTESRPGTASSAAQTEQWPLRNSQDILLPKRAYRPNENGLDGWI